MLFLPRNTAILAERRYCRQSHAILTPLAPECGPRGRWQELGRLELLGDDARFGLGPAARRVVALERQEDDEPDQDREARRDPEAAGAAGLTIEDTLLPQAFGQAKPELISQDEGVGKMKAAVDGRSDPSLVVMGRTGAVSITNLDDAIKRARAYEATGVDALFFTGIKTRAELEAIAAATKLPIVLGGAPEDMTTDRDYLANQRVRIALQGHAPFAAATLAVYETLKALRDGTSPKNLKGLASAELMGRVTRDTNVKVRAAEFLGLKK